MASGIPPYTHDDCLQIVEGYISSAGTRSDFSVFHHGYALGLIGGWELAGLFSKEEAEAFRGRLKAALEVNEDYEDKHE